MLLNYLPIFRYFALIILIFSHSCNSGSLIEGETKTSKKLQEPEAKNKDKNVEVVQVLEKPEKIEPPQVVEEQNNEEPKNNDEPTVLDGDISSLVNGFYDNPKWNELLIKIDGDYNVTASYDYRKGTLTGEYDPDSGVVIAWWCEERKGKRGETKEDYGEAEFSFITDKNGKIDMIGKWRHGTKGEWIEDWDLTLIPNPDESQKSIKEKLEGWLKIDSYFCYRP